MLETEIKKEITKISEDTNDTGSPEVQIALLTKKKKRLVNTLKNLRKILTQTRILKLIGQRRKLLRYLQAENPSKYLEVIKKLNIRK